MYRDGGFIVGEGKRRFVKAGSGTEKAAPIIGSSPGMRAVRERMERIALTDFTVLIEGLIGR